MYGWDKHNNDIQLWVPYLNIITTFSIKCNYKITITPENVEYLNKFTANTHMRDTIFYRFHDLPPFHVTIFNIENFKYQSCNIWICNKYRSRNSRASYGIRISGDMNLKTYPTLWICRESNKYHLVSRSFFESNHIDTVCVPQMGSTDHTSVHILYNSERLNYSWMVLVMVTSQ